jgi:ubiquinone biosynthesis protein COQ9
MDEATEKDRLLMAALANVPFDGWSIAALRAGARAAGIAEAEALALFPRGAAELVEWFSGWADRAMLARLDSGEFSALKVRDRVAAGIRARLAVLGPHREAARSALAVLALPQNVPLGLKLVYHTVDAIWYAAGDTATDLPFSNAGWPTPWRCRRSPSACARRPTACPTPSASCVQPNGADRIAL